MNRLNKILFHFLTACLCGTFLTSCLDPDVHSTVTTELYLSQSEATELLSKSWLIIPFAYQKLSFGEIYDHGKFIKKIQAKRTSQKVELFGMNPEKLTRLQSLSHAEYILQIQQNRWVSDSLIYELKGDSHAEVILAPLVFSHQVTQTESGIFLRRMVIVVKAFDSKQRRVILKLNCTSTHSAFKKSDLISGVQLFESSLKAISEDFLYHPLAGLSPQSEPDY